MIVWTPRIRSWLKKNDPQALRQAEAAWAHASEVRPSLPLDEIAPYESYPAETAAIGRRLGEIIETERGPVSADNDSYLKTLLVVGRIVLKARRSVISSQRVPRSCTDVQPTTS